MPAGSARRVEDNRRRKGIEQQVHDRLFEGEQAEGAIIRLRPEAVSFREVIFGSAGGACQVGGVVHALQEPADLVHTGPAGGGVAVGSQAEERKTLDAQQHFAKIRPRSHRHSPLSIRVGRTAKGLILAYMDVDPVAS